ARLTDALSEKKRKWIGLHRLRCDWLHDALSAALAGRQARWQALLEESSELIARITDLIATVGQCFVSIPPSRDATAVRGDAEAALTYLQAGGKWTLFGVLAPRALKDKQYLREEVRVDGRPADTPDQLVKVCRFLDLSFAFGALDSAWSDYG